MKHTLWMLIGCVLPFLVIFLLPAFGISGGQSTLLFAVMMLGCHLMMMLGHGDHDHDSKHGPHDPAKEIRHE